MSHANAPLTPAGRLRLVRRCESRPIAHVAAEAGISRQCLSKWKARYDQLGEVGLLDRSSAPHTSPTQLDPQVVGAAVLAGFSFGLSVFVFQLRMDASRDPRVPRGSRLLDLIDELFANVLYLIVVGVGLTVLTVVAATVRPDDVDRLNAWWTGAVAALGLHYVLTLGMCVKRMRAAYEELNI